MLRFLLNNTLIEEPDLPADLTVLDYLREQCRLTGTKEGCASGDCGACTVVVASLHEDRLRYRSINSCIALMGDLHGSQLITVEHLASGDELHCTQQAMVDCHGSQCGFCTPGFVMSLFALCKNAASIDPQSQRSGIEHYLGGNLCRCTGYRPIIDAAEITLDRARAGNVDQFAKDEALVVAQLKAIESQHSAERFFRPQTLDALFACKKDYPNAPCVAGCTDFSLEITQRLRQYPQLISLSSIDSLKTIELRDDMWHIGAGCTIASLLDTLGPLHDDIADLLYRYGSTQVRNQATVGGNIGNASPIGDLPPLFIALGADVVLRSADSERVMPLETFFIDYKQTALQADEIITGIRFPAAALDKPAAFKVCKISKRIDDDISSVCAVFHCRQASDKSLQLTAAFGGMAAIPKRALALEAVALSHPFDIERASDALQKDFQPISDARASADYRLTVAKNLYIKFVSELNNAVAAAAVYKLEADHV